MKYIINALSAFILYPFYRWRLKKRNIWLIGGHAGDLYNDNSKVLYEHILEKNPEIEIYWVVNKNSKNYDKIPGNKLNRGEIKTYLYYYCSRVGICSHSPSADLVPYVFAIPIINRFHYRKVFNVYLNHGTVSLKRRKPMTKWAKRLIDKLLASYDLATVSSDFEKEVMWRDWGLKEKNIVITGGARFDTLDPEKNREVVKRQILLIPTWRDWIRNDDMDFKKTKYYENIIGLVNNRELNKFLKEKNVELRIYLHHLMHKYLDEIKFGLEGEQLVFLDSTTNVGREIREASLMITDYSSTAMDFLYLKKAVLFFQFDREEYEKKMGSYINLESDLFGDKAYTINECTNEIKNIINRDFKENINQKNARDNYFHFKDKHNCERIIKEIIKRLDNSKE